MLSSSAFLMLTIMGVLLLTSPAETCNQFDRDSLLSFSGNITARSSSPLDWDVSVDCCTWEGVTCDATGRVSSLKLPSRGLAGSLSPSISNLRYLEELNLSANFFTGTFPGGFFMPLSRLKVIDLSFNRLSGRLSSASYMIPATAETVDFSSNDFEGIISATFLKQAVNLESFNISNNSFEGLIPSSITPSIRVLDFSNNNFFSSIPQDLGNCTKLETLRGGFNRLWGPLPQEIYKLSALKELSFPSNRLSGSLSDEISGLHNLTILSIYGNDLTGEIPPGIGKLSNLEHLLLHINHLYGNIPPSLTNCTRLARLNLRVNSLTGHLSEFDFSKFTLLRMIDLGNNFFQGSLPKSLFACKSLTAIRLGVNQLTGEIPSNIQALESLSYFSLSNNSLTNVAGAIRILSRCRTLSILLLSKNFYNESLPGDYDDGLLDSEGFQNLQVLGLGGSHFNGQIPGWLTKLPKLKVLDLSVNHLKGSIPSLFGSLPNLFYLDLSVNQLSGNFPVELTRMPRLASQEDAEQADKTYLELPVFVRPDNIAIYTQQYNQLSSLPPAIYLSCNNLSGDIPAEIGRLKFIHTLDLSENHFSGGIPSTISYLINLEKLDLSQNNFSGEIPASLGNLPFLSLFNVSGNNLQGPIPTGGQFDTFPEEYFVGNPGLCGTSVQRSCVRKSAATRHPPTKRQIHADKIIFNIFVGVCFGVGFIISTVAMWNYEIEGSFLHVIMKKVVRVQIHAL